MSKALQTKPAPQEELSADLPALIDRASQALTGARSSAELLEAREMADVVYDLARRRTRMRKAKGAYDDVVERTRRAQADAIMILAAADARLADQYDEAQKKGEVVGPHGAGRKLVSDGKQIATAKEIGLSGVQVHKARKVRDAEKKRPGIVKEAVEASLKRGEEPSKAALRKAVEYVLANPGKVAAQTRTSRRNPHYKPNPPYDRLLSVVDACRTIVEKTEGLTLEKLVDPCVDTGMLERTLVRFRACRDRLNNLL